MQTDDMQNEAQPTEPMDSANSAFSSKPAEPAHASASPAAGEEVAKTVRKKGRDTRFLVGALYAAAAEELRLSAGITDAVVRTCCDRVERTQELLRERQSQVLVNRGTVKVTKSGLGQLEENLRTSLNRVLGTLGATREGRVIRKDTRHWSRLQWAEGVLKALAKDRMGVPQELIADLDARVRELQKAKAPLAEAHNVEGAVVSAYSLARRALASSIEALRAERNAAEARAAAEAAEEASRNAKIEAPSPIEAPSHAAPPAPGVNGAKSNAANGVAHA